MSAQDVGPEDTWYEITDETTAPSPQVLIFPERVTRNIRSAIRSVGGAERLRPHVKTHKSRDVVRLHLDEGISKFKCSTLSEAVMLVDAGASDVLIAYQLVGPNQAMLCDMIRRFPGTGFACLVDNADTVTALEREAQKADVQVTVYIDLDVGMHRTGIVPDDDATELYRRIARSSVLIAGGLHAYDGHIHDSDLSQRRERAAEARLGATRMRDQLLAEGFPVPELVVGGTPTFPCHAAALEDGMSASPGTYPYFDWGYATNFPDLPFVGAAVLLARVISVPAPGRFTVDVGSKAIAADPVQPRGTILNLPEAEAGPQSEEHWVFTVSQENTPGVGEVMYIWPRHICPTIEHYNRVAVVSGDGRISAHWEVTARGRDGIAPT
ncbi:MAG: D-TA family PLP-dependent enzyme [Spirochaetes bacterium]|jgi:D-serine deaminase-like pyridoxal phosphate-dependent protein|nr:D-TA family PLP-dependent enzyme [Spirochaetota bacterium]